MARTNNTVRAMFVITLRLTAQPVDTRHVIGYNKGEYVGFWAVTVSGNWRVIFRFEESDAFDVDYVDYH
jgi:proteic killer suppression protein